MGLADGKLESTSERPRRVIVLDDDPFVLETLKSWLSLNGFEVSAYESADKMLASGPPKEPACLVLDNQLGGGWTGLQVHEKIRQLTWKVSTVFLTAHWDPAYIVQAMKAGAEGFLIKPFDPHELLEAVALALEKAEAMESSDQHAADARALAALLTQRELEIVKMVIKGLINKEIANQLDLALVTVKVHRGRAMRKLRAGNPAELVHIAGMAGLIA